MLKMKYTQKIFFGNVLESSRYRGKDNIKLNLRIMNCEDVD